MDFLDPRKRKAHNIRLMIGYILVAIAVGLGGWLLLKLASGYGVDTKTGDIVQYGLLFVDSKPGGASIYLNDELKGTTSARLVLPAGTYKLTLKKDGYRNWERSVTVNESSVARYIYPFLFPNEPQITTLKTYSKPIPLITQSPDRRWLLVQLPISSAKVISFDQYDTANLSEPPKTIVLPAGLLTNVSAASSVISEVEWSTDNKNLLLKHTYKNGDEFIVFNRDNPLESYNVNKLFGITPSEVALRDKRFDQLYILNQKGGNLQIGNRSTRRLTPLLKNVLAFKSNGDNLICYVSKQDVEPQQAAAYIWDGRQSYHLYSFTDGSKYLLDLTQFQGNWYYVVGSNSDERVNVYKNPLDSLKNPDIGRAIPLLSLNIQGATKVSFSNNARFIAAQAGQKMSVYDLETQNFYRYSFDKQLSSQMHWMDGHRLIGSSGNMVFISDYDATNQLLLVNTNYLDGGFFDRDYNFLITTADSGSQINLQRVDLRAGADLPRK
jgi:hypothetical protein